MPTACTAIKKADAWASAFGGSGMLAFSLVLQHGHPVGAEGGYGETGLGV